MKKVLFGLLMIVSLIACCSAFTGSTVQAAGGVTWPRGDFNTPIEHGHSKDGVYANHCPSGTTGGYIGGGNYYCHE